MSTKGSVFKRVISGKTYYYHKYLKDGKQVNIVISESEAYSISFDMYFQGNDIAEFYSHKFNLEVVYGEALYNLGVQFKGFKKRFCFSQIEDFFTNPYVGKVLILYGLRRTGKTTLMLQYINELSLKDFSKAAYIKCDKNLSAYQLLDDLKYLFQQGFKYIFIDEVTLLEDFVALSSTISDIYGLMGKIVLSGTDSLGFAIASHDQLYDRYKMIHTTYISFKEFYEVLNIKSIDEYIHYGGTMSMEGVDYNKVINKDNYQVNEYVDSSIIHNIIHSLESVDNGKYFFNLYDLYEKKELENVINRIIEDTNHRFVISIIEKDFKSHDYGSLKQLLSSPRNYERFKGVLDKVDENKLNSDLMNALNIINKEKQTHKIDEAVLLELEYYLKELDVIATIDEVIYPSFSVNKRTIFTQPGLRYAQAKALVDILLSDQSLKQYDLRILDAIKEKLLSDVKGRMMEDIVIYETSLKNKDTFKMYFATLGEYDMVCLNTNEMTSSIFEIKYATSAIDEQYKNLIKEDLKTIFENKYYPIIERTVLYRGENKAVNDVNYRNIEDYLIK